MINAPMPISPAVMCQVHDQLAGFDRSFLRRLCLLLPHAGTVSTLQPLGIDTDPLGRRRHHDQFRHSYLSCSTATGADGNRRGWPPSPEFPCGRDRVSRGHDRHDAGEGEHDRRAGKALDAIATISSNDLAVAVAERIAGSEPKFARVMTAKARQLGMRNTRFANASGLTSAGNVTTASDMAKLSRAIVRRFPRQYARFSKRTIQWRSRRTANHNHLLGRVTGVDGIKTGYTSDAG
jgi:hypothetical protein